MTFALVLLGGDDPDCNCTGIIITGVFGQQFSSNSCNDCLGRRIRARSNRSSYLQMEDRCSRYNDHTRNCHSKRMNAIAQEIEHGNGSH